MFRQLLILIIACILLTSGLIHIAQPYFFIYSAAAYQIVSSRFIWLPMTVLPYLQIVIAICLVLQVARGTALALGGALFFLFSVAQAIVIFRGSNISCGCFGYSGATVGPSTVMISIVSAGLCFFLVVTEKENVTVSNLPRETV